MVDSISITSKVPMMLIIMGIATMERITKQTLGATTLVDSMEGTADSTEAVGITESAQPVAQPILAVRF